MLIFLSPLHKATRQVSLWFGEQMADMDLSPQEGHVLSYLNAYAPCPISELVRVFGLKQSTLTSLLDRLEERNLITRAVNPEDRRSFLIDVTRGGRTVAQKLNRLTERLEQGLRRRVNTKDIEGFRMVMKAIGEFTQVEIRKR